MKATNSDHISVALKKKLIRRMEFTKYKRQFLHHKKLMHSGTLTARNMNSLQDLNFFDRSISTKNLGIDFLRPASTIPPVDTGAKFANDPVMKEYGVDKYEELKSNPELKTYFKEMFLNPNKAFKKKKSKSNSKGKRAASVHSHYVKMSDSVGLNRHK